MKDNVFSKMMGHTVINVNYAVHIGGANGVQVSVPIEDAKKRSQLRWSSVWASATVQLVDCPARMKIVFLPIQSATRTNVI